MNAESFKEVGISWANDKIYGAVNLMTLPADASKRKPKTKYANAIASFSDRGYLVEAGYNWFSGYYEKNSQNFVRPFNESMPYYDYGKLRTLNILLNYVRFNNYKKFSYNAAYRGNARQKKSAGSALYYLSLNYNRAESDTAIIPFQVRKSYDRIGSMNKLFNFYVNGGVGASGTLVIMKTLYFNATGMVGPGLQFQQYSLVNEHGLRNRINLMLYGDVRFAVGLNLKRFVISSITIVNFKYYNLQKVNITNNYLCSSFNIGYRFNTRNARYRK